MHTVLPALFGAALGLLWTGIAAAQTAAPKAAEVPVAGSCSPRQTSYIATDSTDLLTDSQEYVNAPQASVRFQQRTNGCVIVHFTGVVFTSGVEASAPRILVRAVLEGTNLVATPTDVSLSGDDDEDFDGHWARAHAMIFVFPSVTAGRYKASVQWKSPDGQAVFMHQHTVFIRHQ
jgi:hypothetical protein